MIYNSLLFSLQGISDTEVNEKIAQEFNISPPFRLEHFTYSNDKLTEIIFKHLANTSFNGISVLVVLISLMLIV